MSREREGGAGLQTTSASDGRPRWLTLPVMAVGALTVIGMALRLAVANDAVGGDEASTYWVVSGRALDGVISAVQTDQEITPPLYYLTAWLSAQIDDSPHLLRAPSFLAGAASIPAIYLLGLRTVGRRAALVAAALTTLSPFMIFFSAEARAYGLMMVLVMVSTLAMLFAVDEGGRARWWVIYGIASCAAVYTHYTCVFALGAQLVWLLWAHPEARKPALLANFAAAAAFLPWLPGLADDLNSPTADNLSALAPFGGRARSRQSRTLGDRALRRQRAIERRPGDAGSGAARRGGDSSRWPAIAVALVRSGRRVAWPHCVSIAA